MSCCGREVEGGAVSPTQRQQGYKLDSGQAGVTNPTCCDAVCNGAAGRWQNRRACWPLNGALIFDHACQVLPAPILT